MKHFFYKSIIYSFALLVISLSFISHSSLGFGPIQQARALEPVTQETLNTFNPLTVGQAERPAGNTQDGGDFTTLGGVINRVMIFIFPLAVLILFVMLFWAGFEMFSGATDKGSLEKGKNRATMAIVGFILLFVSYWVMQLVETILGITIISF